jgi:predicted Zn-dependent protease
MNSETFRNLAVIAAVVAGAWFIVTEVRRTVSPAQETAQEIAQTANTIEGVLKQDPVNLLESMHETAIDVLKDGENVFDRTMGLTVEEENEWGKLMHDSIIQSSTVHPDRGVQESVNKLASVLFDQAERKDLTYTFTVLDDPNFGAFSILGGYVYVNIGLLEEYDYDDDAVLFVLGHEMAHIDLGQCRRKTNPFVRGLEMGGQEVGDILQLMRQVLASGYDQDEEFECDQWSYEKMRALGKSKEARLKGVRGLAAFEERVVGDSGRRERPSLDDESRTVQVLTDIVEDHLTSHPPSAERVKRLEALP